MPPTDPGSDPAPDRPEGADGPSADGEADRLGAEAARYRRSAAERPESVRDERRRIVEVLSAERPTNRTGLRRRAAASDALAILAADDPASLDAVLPALVEELRREADRELPDGDPELAVRSRTVRDGLVWTVAQVLVGASEPAVEPDAFGHFVGAVSTDLDDGTLRAATRAFFDRADERSSELASAAVRLDELLAYPDAVVQAWVAGTVGRVAATRPDAVAATAGNLRRLLGHDVDAVQHNAVEALAGLVGARPDAVAPAAGALRGLLDHDEAAIQHNAAGVLGRLAADYPDSVLPAVDGLVALRDHDEAAVRRTASAALSRLARARPDALAGRLREDT